MKSWDFPDTDREEQPDATVKNVPDEIVEAALSIATIWKKCPDCGVEQFVNAVPGHNSTHMCENCEESFTVVG